MNIFSKNTVLLVVFSLLSSVIWTQDQPEKDVRPNRKKMSPEMQAQKRADAMARELELSDLQREKIYTAHLHSIRERDQLIKNHRNALRSLKKTNRSAVANALTENQLARWEGIQKGRKQMLREGRKKHIRRGHHMRRPNDVRHRSGRTKMRMRSRSRI